MESNESQVNSVVEPSATVDEQKLNRIIIKILKLENDNVKTNELNDEDIKKKISKIIEEEIRCC